MFYKHLLSFVISHIYLVVTTLYIAHISFLSVQCYVFHLYVGVRAGGGIGDEIESPDGDPNEVFRILFDITFFFFVIIILLAIIQGMYKVGGKGEGGIA